MQNLRGSSDLASWFNSISDTQEQGKGKRKYPTRGYFSAPPAPCEVPETSQPALSGDICCPPYTWLLVPVCTNSNACASAAPWHRAGEQPAANKEPVGKPPGRTSSLDSGTPSLHHWDVLLQLQGYSCVFSCWSEEFPTATVLSDQAQGPALQSAGSHRWQWREPALPRPCQRRPAAPLQPLGESPRCTCSGEAVKPGGFRLTCSMQGLVFAQLQLSAKYERFLRDSAFSAHPFFQET